MESKAPKLTYIWVGKENKASQPVTGDNQRSFPPIFQNIEVHIITFQNVQLLIPLSGLLTRKRFPLPVFVHTSSYYCLKQVFSLHQSPFSQQLSLQHRKPSSLAKDLGSSQFLQLCTAWALTQGGQTSNLLSRHISL